MQQRTLETKQSELKQAESEIERTEAEQRRRVASAQSERDEAKKALERARLEIQGNELRARIDAENFVIAVSNAEEHVRELEKKIEGERIAAQADVAIARQKRDKALYDVKETERIIGVAAGSRADRRIDLAAAELPRRRTRRRCRAGVQARRSRLVRRADRGAAGPDRRADDRARGRSRSRPHPDRQRRPRARRRRARPRADRHAEGHLRRRQAGLHDVAAGSQLRPRRRRCRIPIRGCARA